MPGEKGMSSIDFAAVVYKDFWDWSSANDVLRTGLMVAMAAIAVIIALTIFLKTLIKALDGALKVGEFVRSSGLPRPMSRESRLKVRRRSQFCAVLEADLTNIAKAESWNDQYFTDLEAEV